jgi:ABC-2 type transport system ATP-binding protein
VPEATTSPDAPDAPAPAAPMIRAEGLGRRFGDLWAIRDVNFELQAGEVFGLLGPNGAGKTTTVRLLTALIAPSEGRAWVDGLDVVEDAEAVRSRIGLLTETPGLYERLTAVQNLEFFGRLHQLPADLRADRIERLLRLFDLWDRRDTLTGTFSKGMKQKLAIARAMLHEPAVLFFDEPTSALDPEAAFIVRDALETLRAAGRTIVLCTHNLDEAERLCDRVAFVRGQVLRIDSPARLRRSAAGSTIEVELVAEPGTTVLPALRRRPGVRAIEVAGARLTVIVEDVRLDTPGVVRTLVLEGAEVLGVRETTATLESVYFDVMGFDAAGNGAPSP